MNNNNKKGILDANDHFGSLTISSLRLRFLPCDFSVLIMFFFFLFPLSLTDFSFLLFFFLHSFFIPFFFGKTQPWFLQFKISHFGRGGV